MDFFTPECSSSSTKTVKEQKEDKRSNSPLTHLFVELTSLEELSFPTSSSTRIKFTCLDASAHYLAVGSTSGTVYLFSRFASKYRNRISSVPIQVISIKDGPIIKLSISPDEKYLATASKRGSLTVTVLVGVGQNPITLFSSESHVGTDECGQPTYVTELRWCNDSSKVYAGDTKGRISRTLIHNRNFFRSPTDIIFETDSEIVQFDLRDDFLLASTLTRCCICDLRTYSCIQVGKRLRKGHFGAVFYSDQKKRISRYEEESNCMKSMSTNGCNELTVIFASRPNGRLWEANSRGVVYSTHQYRNLTTVCRFPVVSFKEDNLFDSMASANEVQSINFGLLTLIKCQNSLFLITKTDTTFCLIDPTDSHMVLMSTMDCIGAVSEYAVNDADIFLLSEKGGLRKLTLFTVEKAVEKLHWRQCYSQAAQLIYVDYITNKDFNSVTVWNFEQLEDILNKITVHHLKSHLAHVRNNDVIDILQKLLNELKRNGDTEGKPKAAVHRLSSGIHRVVQVMENSGYEDDFTFRAPSPLRLRSKSTLHIEVYDFVALLKIKNNWKRRSLPLNRRNVMEIGEDEIKFEDLGERQRKLINEARILLLDAEKAPVNQLIRNGSVESLRTLLDGSNSLILFDQQVTINDIARDLVAAKKFQRLIGRHKNYEQKQKQRTTQVDFKSLFGRRDPLEILEKCVESMPLNVNVNVAHLRTIRRTRRGARIVKGIKPSGRKNVSPLSQFFIWILPLVVKLVQSQVAPEVEYEKSKCCEWNSEQSMKRDLTSNGSLNLNCNETSERNCESRYSSIDQLSKNDTGLLNKSYVIEKNFVAVQPIEMTWTVNGDDEENNSASMKSLEAVATLSGEDKRLVHSSEVTVIPETLILSGTGKRDGEKSVYCQVCGLHRLWYHVMTFGPKMSQLRVTVDQFAAGGVPTAIEQWTKLFEYRAAAANSSESFSGSLCNTCTTFFEFDDQLKQKASSFREMVERIEKRSMRKKCTQNLVQMKTKDWDEDLVYRVFFKNITIVTKRPSVAQNKVDAISHREVSREPVFEKCPKKFLWLPAVKTSQLLLCMCYCEGLSTVFEFLKNNRKLPSYLTTEDWQWLAVMKAYESNRIFNLMPKEVITDLLTELKISTIEDIGAVSSASICDVSGMVSSSKSLSGSLTISVDGNCTCCTLPLKVRVSQDAGYITVFRCGHLYHQICLREANLSQCVRCELERRRHRQKQQQMDNRAEVSNPSNSSSARRSRHLPIIATRATLTSSSNIKVPQRT
uniref:Hermansky-Pudlak syndrome 5 protein homolog n=1 Tax=Elaeophora elaphi TaxID=1147741 RepID=A0A0R3RZ63_9BILA